MATITVAQPHATTFRAPRIQAGLSIGNLYIGGTLRNTTDTLKSSGIISTYEEEFSFFENFDYNPSNHLQFILGFDEVVMYQEDNQPILPIFKAYFQREVLSFLIISSYGSGAHDFSKCQDIYTEKGLAFGDTIEDMEDRHGRDHILHIYGNYDGEYIYLKQGISFLFENNRLRVIRLFAPITQPDKIAAITSIYSGVAKLPSNDERVLVELDY